MINLDQKMKITCIEQTIHSFLSAFHFLSSSLSVRTYSLMTQTQQKTASHNQYIHLDRYQSPFGGNTFQLPPCTNCVNTEISKAVMAAAFESVQPIAATIVPAPKIMNHTFCILLKQLACIALLQTGILPSKPLMQP